MKNSNSLVYRLANAGDCHSLVTFVNESYRGEKAQQGWTNENELVDGKRTTADALKEIINSHDSIILIFFDEGDPVIQGCVCLQHQPILNRANLGMLTVRPDLQQQGYGKSILSVVENYAKTQWNVDSIELTVVLQRTELVDYYKRRGYIDSGKRELFPLDEFGHPKRNDLQFCTLIKSV